MDINESISRKREQLSKLRSNLSTSGLGALEKRLQAALENSSSEECIPRRTQKGPVRLSFPQQSVWIVEQLQPGGAAYHIPAAFRLKGHLDLSALKYSLDELIGRHESLRTSFTQIGDEPLQTVTEAVEIRLPVDDLTGLPEESKEAEARERVRNETHRSFDLTAAPLFRARLLKLGDVDHILILVMHHIVSDVWSMGILSRELRTLYNSYRRGESSPLSELPVQYPDFALWQRENLRGEILDQQLDYWKRRLSGAPATLELPTDHPRPTSLSSRGSVQIFTFPDQLSESLRRLSLQEGATLFMTLLAAFNLLLSRYSSQKDIVVGCDIASRNRAELEGLIGFFVNTLAIRTDLSDDPSFRRLLGRVKEVCLGAYAHQHLPFERLVAELQPERRSNYSPIFQVMFSLQSRHEQREPQGGNWDGLSVSGFAGKGQTAMFDLSFRIIEGRQSLAATLEYSTDLFEPETIKRMLRHFRVLLEAIVARPEDRISSLPLLSDAERRELLEVWNDTGREYPQEGCCIHHLFEQQALRTPDAVALVFKDERVSYGQLNARANQLAHYLLHQGITAEAVVGILMERSVEMLVAVLGVLKAGAAYLPLDAAYPPERLRFMVEDAEVQLLLTQRSVGARIGELRVKRLCLDSDCETLQEQSRENPLARVSGENLAYLIYTSGSTGLPKGVMVRHRSLLNFMLAAVEHYQFRDTDRVLQFASLSFDTSAEEIYPSLVSGATLVLRSEAMLYSATEFLRECEERQITVLDLPTAYWHELTREVGREGLGIGEGIRLVIVGGEKAQPTALERWRKGVRESLRLVNGYGPTEATIVATWCDLNNGRGNVGVSGEVPIGRAIANVRVYVLDEHGQPVPIGVPGELHIGGVSLARGYVNRPELTAEKFIPDPYCTAPGGRLYKTGDLTRYLADGNLQYLGRTDQQVKLRGFRIELGEIESTLNQHPEIKESVVMVREDSPGDKRLVAYIVAVSDLDIAAVRSFLAKRLPHYMIPAAFVTLDALPLSPSGKVGRKALPTPESASIGLAAEFVAPRSSLEQELAEMWARLLGVKRVGVQDNFFELGGHSLLLTRLATRIRDTFGVEVPVRILFDAPTIEGMSISIGSQLMDQSDAADLALLLAEMGEPTSDETTAL